MKCPGIFIWKRPGKSSKTTYVIMSAPHGDCECGMLCVLKTVAISYTDKKLKKRNFFGKKLRTAKSKERSKSENALDIEQSESQCCFSATSSCSLMQMEKLV